jgi:hypothetical protein
MLLYGSYVNFSRAHVKFSCRNAILWCNKVNALYSVVRVIDHYCTGMFLTVRPWQIMLKFWPILCSYILLIFLFFSPIFLSNVPIFL